MNEHFAEEIEKLSDFIDQNKEEENELIIIEGVKGLFQGTEKAEIFQKICNVDQSGMVPSYYWEAIAAKIKSDSLLQKGYVMDILYCKPKKMWKLPQNLY